MWPSNPKRAIGLCQHQAERNGLRLSDAPDGRQLVWGSGMDVIRIKIRYKKPISQSSNPGHSNLRAWLYTLHKLGSICLRRTPSTKEAQCRHS